MVGKWRGNAYVAFKADEAKMKDGGHTAKDVYTAPHLTKQEKEPRTKLQISHESINTIAFSQGFVLWFINCGTVVPDENDLPCEKII